MLIVFGNDKCPMCGDFGKEIDKKVLHCGRCNVAYDGFVITGRINENMMNPYEGKYWN